MKYNYRWYYVVTIVFAAILVLVVSSSARISHIFELRRSIAVLEQKLISLPPAKISSPVSRTELTTELVTSYTLLPKLSELAGLTGVTMNASNLMASVLAGVKHWKVHINVSGSYAQIAEFLTLLDTQPFSVLLLNFTYQMDKKAELLFDGELVVLANHVASARTVIPHYHNPFCNSPKLIITNKQMSAELTQFPLNQLRMIGYYHYGDENQALILLPNKHVLASKIGNQIGSELSKIINIEPSAITISTGSGSYIMKMRMLNE